jgi:hypothetical protein
LALSPASSHGLDTSTANTWTGNQTAPAWIASGLTGATAASRYVGATASGAPGSGTFAIGDFVIDQTAKIYVCTVAGSPGTWVQVGGGAAPVTKLYDSTLGAPAASFDTGAASIAAGYSSIELLLYARSVRVAASDEVYIQFNNDATAIYDWQRAGASNTTGTFSAVATDNGFDAFVPAASAAANVFGVMRMSVAGYDIAAGQRAVSYQDGFADTTIGNSRAYTRSGTYRSTSAITRIKVVSLNSANLATGSRFVVYGYA